LRPDNIAPNQAISTPSTEKNVIKVATKQHKDKLYFKRESIDTSNIIEGNRGTRNNQNIVTPERPTPSTRLKERN
jgi:hypothetical protein